MRERTREQVGFESIPENSESRSWCDDVRQTVPETATGHRKGTVANSNELCSSDDDQERRKTSAQCYLS